MTKAKFKVGQVVRMNTEWYRTRKMRGEQYQRITRVWEWPTFHRQTEIGGFGYTLLNGDEAHEKFLAALTSAERGPNE
jgi:hypothetical protein